MVLWSSVGSPAGEPVAAHSHGMPDLSREGPFDVHQDASESGATPHVLDSMPGCQYRMTSYDEDVDRSDLSPAFGIHLHDARLYVGSMWVHPSRLDSSAVVRSIGCITWVGTEHCRLLYSFSMTDIVHSTGPRTVRPVPQPDVVRGHARGVRTQTIPDRSCTVCGAVSPSTTSAHYMAAMGLWCLPYTQGIPGPLPSSFFFFDGVLGLFCAHCLG